MPLTLIADAGLPMIVIEWPLMLCALIPVIVIETEVIRRRLSLPYTRALSAAAMANACSTAAGVPLAWVVTLVVQLLASAPLILVLQKWQSSPVSYLAQFLSIAWLGPPAYSLWPIPFAASVLLVPTFFASVWLERPVYRRALGHAERALVDRSVRTANLASYSVLFVAACAWLVWAIVATGETAPPTKRFLQNNPIDLPNLHDVFIPAFDARLRPQLLQATGELEAALRDFHSFMHSVETGKMPVRKRLDTGRWVSSAEEGAFSVWATYTDKLGPIVSFDKRKRNNRSPGVYRFIFNKTGYITDADVSTSNFDFDDTGRATRWRPEK
jgi:hypothetical protein